MNRTALGLAIGAGYLLGRTKKLKMAVAVGGLVAGKKLNLGPRMITDLVSTQLQKNPQFKELGDQLRGDLRGAGKAASGALVERQLDSLADKLHDRTTEMREQLTGSGRPDREAGDGEETEDATDKEPDDEEPEPAPERPAKKASSKRAPSKEAAKKASAKKAPARKAAPAKKTAGKKTAAARTTSSRGTRTSKGGGER
ncbi:DNA primase [Streptomyces sp. M2CJ-2]|uniref:DNA primase n=1 Tax=Streptomyces sp. M2CJ-2 TaxID=2803948 RepID=UPI001922D96D|nr:DNA primase [Streptomyces sp. M2CJ-2]MBL3666298.1 DNA primase [Streptomyces sp. M2CJ-2]